MVQACNPSLLAASGMCKVPSTHQLGNSHGNYVNGEDTGPFRQPTRWSCNVDPHNPLPEYPRPQLERQNWLSLNGVWEWQAAPCVSCPLLTLCLMHHLWCPIAMHKGAHDAYVRMEVSVCL